ELVLHFLEFARFDLPIAAALVVAEREELILAAEIEREEFVDEGNVVVELAHLEGLAPPETQALIPIPAGLQRVTFLPLFAEPTPVPAIFDVAEQLDPELVWIQLSR